MNGMVWYGYVFRVRTITVNRYVNERTHRHTQLRIVVAIVMEER